MSRPVNVVAPAAHGGAMGGVVSQVKISVGSRKTMRLSSWYAYVVGDTYRSHTSQAGGNCHGINNAN